LGPQGEQRDEAGEMERERLVRLLVVGVLVASYAGIGLYLNVAHNTSAVYTHFAYIPIVLAGVWWGRRGVVVAAAVGGIILAFHAVGISAGGVWNDLARVVFLLVVALTVGTLSEKVAAGQQAVLRSEEKHRLIVEKSLTGIVVYGDSRFEVLFANPRCERLFGRRPEAMVGMSIWDLIAEEDKPQVRDRVADRRAKGFVGLHYECRLVRADGSRFWAEIASSAATYEGQPAVLVNVYDISDRKEAEEKRRELARLARKQEEQLVHSTRLAELGEMSAAVAHDLNQPLTGIRNFARNALYMLAEGAGSHEDVQENLRLIAEQVDRAAKIIGQMRGMTRKSDRELAPVDLNSIIRESVEFLTPQLRLTGVETTLQLAPDLPPITGDRTRLEQVFLNLLTNARQAMEEAPERRLVVRTSVHTDPDRPVVVEVEDTGKGFADDDVAKLFAPFYSTKKPGHGTGLGLTISQRIIKDHGGAIAATGQPGRGATFTLRLPLPQHAPTREV
jgi:histidine kinase